MQSFHSAQFLLQESNARRIQLHQPRLTTRLSWPKLFIIASPCSQYKSKRKPLQTANSYMVLIRLAHGFSDAYAGKDCSSSLQFNFMSSYKYISLILVW